MVSSISKKKSMNIKGVLNVEDNIITVDCDDMDTMELSALLVDFAGQAVTISVNQTEEIS